MFPFYSHNDVIYKFRLEFLRRLISRVASRLVSNLGSGWAYELLDLCKTKPDTNISTRIALRIIKSEIERRLSNDAK